MTLNAVPARWVAEAVSPTGERLQVSAPTPRMLLEVLSAQLGIPLAYEPAVARLDTPEQRLLRAMATDQEIDASGLASTLSISKSMAHARILRALRGGILIRVARGIYRAVA